MRKVISVTDSVNECDCCGKQNLKKTYLVFDDETTTEYYYGSTCVGRNLGIDSKEVNKQIRESEEQRKVDARNEYDNNEDVIAFNKALKTEYEFLDEFYNTVVHPLSQKCYELKKQLETKYNIKYFNR